MIDLNDIKFNYSKIEVDDYCSKKNVRIEDLLQLLIIAIKVKARVPVSHFQVGAGAYTQSGQIFLGTNIEMAHTAINHTIHAEQCTLSNMFLNTSTKGIDRILILSVTETPCGHCRQILQELFDAKDVRIIVNKHDDVVHHIFENEHLVEYSSLVPRVQEIASHLYEKHVELCGRELIAEGNWYSVVISRVMMCYSSSFSWYSGTSSVAMFLTRNGDYVIGCGIESSAYNPTINCLQMAIVSCQINDISFDDISLIILIENDKCMFSYRGYAEVLRTALHQQNDNNSIVTTPFIYYTLFPVYT